MRDVREDTWVKKAGQRPRVRQSYSATVDEEVAWLPKPFSGSNVPFLLFPEAALRLGSSGT